MKTKTSFLQKTSITLAVILILMNFIVPNIFPSIYNVKAATRLEKLDDSSKKEGDLYEDGKIYKIDDKYYAIYYGKNGEAYGVEYTSKEIKKAGTTKTTIQYNPVDFDEAKEHDLPYVDRNKKK